MSTGSKKVDIFLKKFISQQEITVNFFDYLENLAREQFSKVYRNSGIFVPDIKVTTLFSSSAVNTFDLVTPLITTDGPTGHIISLDPSFATQIPFQNTVAVDYFVGLRFQRLPQKTEINVRAGKIEYTFGEEAIGELAEPDSVVDDGDETLTVIVDSVTEAGVSNAGRKIRIWLKQAVSEIEAFEEVTVIWDGSNNKIETTTALGQVLGSVSTIASDYQVALLGTTVKRNTDLRLDANILFLGIVTGVGIGSSPTVFNQSDANDLSTGLGILSGLFNVEHAPLTGIHSAINPDTIDTKPTVTGPQLTTKVNVSDEDTPDVPVSHSLFPSSGGSGIQGAKWRLQDSSGATIAFVDAHGNAYFQNLAAVQSTFQSSIIVDGDATLGDSIASDKVTFNSLLQSLTDMIYLIDSNNDGTTHAHKFYNHDTTAGNLLAQITEGGDVLSKAGTEYKKADGTTVATDASLNEVYDETAFRDLVKTTPNATNDKAINIAGSRLTAKDGSDHILAVGGLISNYSGGTVNFGTGVVTGGGANFTPIDFSGQASQWAKYSVSLLVGDTLSVIPAIGFGATKATAPEPLLANNSTAAVVIAVQDDGAAGVGTIENIGEANIDRIFDGAVSTSATIPPPPLMITLSGSINQLYENIDGFFRSIETKKVQKINLTARNSGTGTTTVTLRLDGGGTKTADLVGDGSLKSTVTILGTTLDLVDGDIFSVDLTAIAENLNSLTIELIFIN